MGGDPPPFAISLTDQLQATAMGVYGENITPDLLDHLARKLGDVVLAYLPDHGPAGFRVEVTNPRRGVLEVSVSLQLPPPPD